MKRLLALAPAACIAACVSPPPDSTPAAPAPSPPPVAEQVAPAPPPPPPIAGPAQFVVEGELTQGGWIRGTAPVGVAALALGDTPVTFDAAGHFFAAFDRDAPPSAELRATLRDGREVSQVLTIAPRLWAVEHINAARRPGGATEEFARLREGELAQIVAARSTDTGSEGWRQRMIWPAAGRISGRFGSQRIYRGEPGAYHSGLDIAGGAGATYVAPADGTVVLAARQPFSLEGYLLIIDHGQGFNSAFLHSSALLVKQGDRVVQGQPLGRIGATGRATGPHLHWSLVWRGARLDPLLFLPPR